MKKLLLIIAIIFVSGNVFAGSWTSYDYKTGTYTTGVDNTIGYGNSSVTHGTAYDYGKGTYSSYTIHNTGKNSTITSYDYGTNNYKTTNYWD